MKDQYFGDVNDYRKYGLLRALQGEGRLRLSVVWMLTSNDCSSDGAFRVYLQQPSMWRRFDPDLYDRLTHALGQSQPPDVSMAETHGLLPGAEFFSDVVPDQRLARDQWARRLCRAVPGTDLVFLDPDNGLQVESKPAGRHGSSKYVMWSEVEALWETGASLLIYQHFRRESREPFTIRVLSELADRTGAPLVEGFRTPHVLFLLAGQAKHLPVIEDSVQRNLTRWEGQIDVYRRVVLP